MPKTTLPFDSGAYAPVADRIALFYERHPTGRIVTELVERGDVVVFKALVFRAADDAGASATGWASERVGDGEINAVACVENTETSAIGRALANLGFTASNRRPSAEEMEKAARERGRLARERQLAARDPRLVVARSREQQRRTAIREADPVIANENPAVIDALELVAEAARAGMPPMRAMRLRLRLESGTVGLASVERVERLLRRWLDLRGLHAR
jgi:hypothetical protein